MNVSFIEPDASRTRTSTPFGSKPIAYGSSHTKCISNFNDNFKKNTHYDYFYLLPNCVTGCDHAKDLNVLLVFSGKATCIFPLDALDSGKIELFGSTAIRNSSFTTANKSFIIAMHGSIVRDELVGNKSILRGLSDEICKKKSF